MDYVYVLAVVDQITNGNFSQIYVVNTKQLRHILDTDNSAYQRI